MRFERGLTLVEVLVALLLLGVTILLATTVALHAEGAQRRALRQRLALELAEGEAERIRTAAYGSVADEERDLADVLAAGELPGARLFVTVIEDEDLRLKDVAIEVRWLGRESGRVRLDTAVGSLGLYR